MRKLIFVVDDDTLLRRTLAFNLEQAGYQVNTAMNDEDALETARRKKPDLVLLDIGLPGMDGLDALRSPAVRCRISFCHSSGLFASMADGKGFYGPG